MNTEKRVIDILAKQAGFGNNDTIKTSYDLRNDLNLDSLDLIELWMELDKEFSIEIPEEMLRNFTDVQSVINVVESVIPI